MPYSTLDDLQARRPDDTLIHLSDDKNGATVNTSKVAAAIADADADIDLYVGTQYTVPLSAPVPPKVLAMACDLAIYNLYKNRPGNIPEHIGTLRTDAINVLEQIKDKQITLPIEATATSGLGGGVVESSHFSETPGVSGLET